jgi:hypothetical protein
MTFKVLTSACSITAEAFTDAVSLLCQGSWPESAASIVGVAVDVVQLSLFPFADGGTLERASFECPFLQSRSAEIPTNLPYEQSVSVFLSRSGHLGRACAVPLSGRATHIQR